MNDYKHVFLYAYWQTSFILVTHNLLFLPSPSWWYKGEGDIDLIVPPYFGFMLEPRQMTNSCHSTKISSCDLYPL